MTRERKITSLTQCIREHSLVAQIKKILNKTNCAFLQIAHATHDSHSHNDTPESETGHWSAAHEHESMTAAVHTKSQSHIHIQPEMRHDAALLPHKHLGDFMNNFPLGEPILDNIDDADTPTSRTNFFGYSNPFKSAGQAMTGAIQKSYETTKGAVDQAAIVLDDPDSNIGIAADLAVKIGSSYFKPAADAARIARLAAKIYQNPREAAVGEIGKELTKMALSTGTAFVPGAALLQGPVGTIVANHVLKGPIGDFIQKHALELVKEQVTHLPGSQYLIDGIEMFEKNNQNGKEYTNGDRDMGTSQLQDSFAELISNQINQQPPGGNTIIANVLNMIKTGGADGKRDVAKDILAGPFGNYVKNEALALVKRQFLHSEGSQYLVRAIEMIEDHNKNGGAIVDMGAALFENSATGLNSNKINHQQNHADTLIKGGMDMFKNGKGPVD